MVYLGYLKTELQTHEINTTPFLFINSINAAQFGVALVYKYFGATLWTAQS